MGMFAGGAEREMVGVDAPERLYTSCYSTLGQSLMRIHRHGVSQPLRVDAVP
jgi:hypothetical protein